MAVKEGRMVVFLYTAAAASLCDHNFHPLHAFEKTRICVDVLIRFAPGTQTASLGF